MKQINNKQTLSEFIAEREDLNDCKDGVDVLDAPQYDLFVLTWR